MIAALVVLVLVACGVATILIRDLARGVSDLGRERAALSEEVQGLHERLDMLEEYLRRQGEEMIVLTHVILERGVADEDDIAEIRHRCVEVPMRRAEERDELLQGADLEEMENVVLDDDEASTLH